MKIVIAVLALMPSFAQALSYPQDNPPSVIDDCIPGRPGRPNPRPWPKPHPKPWDDQSLNTLFTGSVAKEKGSETSAVSAGEWTVAPRDSAGLSMPTFTPKGEKAVPSIDGAKFTKVGGLTDAAGKVIVPIVIEAAKEAGRVIDKEIDRRLTAPDTERARQEYGGCRMKGTCPK